MCYFYKGKSYPQHYLRCLVLRNPKVQKHQVYGRLTTVRCQGRNSRREYVWKCKCECGEYKIVSSALLLSGTTQSCGCLRRENSKQMRWAGCGDLSGQYFCSLRLGAEKRGLLFDIDIEYAWNLFVEQDGRCALTGTKIWFRPTTRSEMLGTASLDRIDSSKGYSVDNVHWVHKDINKMKMDLNQDRFIELCCQVAEHIN